MRLGLLYGFSHSHESLDLVLEAERLGYDSVWTGEAWGSDTIVPLAWLAAQTKKIRLGTAIMQMPARTPAMTAMTAMTLDAISGGRFILGIGPSGPQVVEGWHGVPYGKPLVRYREYVAILRRIFAREAPLEFQGAEYQIPYRGTSATGLGKPLRSILHGRRDMEIYMASITPSGVALAAEIADGIIPVWMNPERWDLFQPSLERGFHRAGGARDRHKFDVAPFVTCVMGPDLEKCRAPIRQNLSFYIGGMGARSKNFYNDYARRAGYEEAAVKIQDLFLSGQRDAAVAAVPDKLVDEVALVGPRERIAERVAAWKASPVRTMLIGTRQAEALRALAEMLL
jgi:F420-dependent oxidoreductase-like protein